MLKINKNFSYLSNNYLFYEVNKKIADFEKRTGKKVLSLGVGDVTLPLSKVVANAYSAAALSMGTKEGFFGYAPVGGYDFLKESIVNDYKEKGISISLDEVFISDGAKSDLGALAELFSPSTALIPTPAYPAYKDINLLVGNKVRYLPLSAERGFIPSVKGLKGRYLIFLCSPNNPTGAAYPLHVLQEFVDYALRTKSIIIYDNCYSSFIFSDAPKSIYQAKGAVSCAIEVNSFSKSAGFTGVRCGYSVIPQAVLGGNVQKTFIRRQSTRFNGVSYPVQVAAAAALTKEGKKGIASAVGYYMENAKLFKEAFTRLGLTFFGGEDSPYIWLRCPSPFDCASLFNAALLSCSVALTPGEGFGENGKDYVRISCFCSHQTAQVACKRLTDFIKTAL